MAKKSCFLGPTIFEIYNRTDANVYGYIFEALAPFSTVGNANNMRWDLQCVPVISAMHKRRENRGKYQRLRKIILFVKEHFLTKTTLFAVFLYNFWRTLFLT